MDDITPQQLTLCSGMPDIFCTHHATYCLLWLWAGRHVVKEDGSRHSVKASYLPHLYTIFPCLEGAMVQCDLSGTGVVEEGDLFCLTDRAAYLFSVRALCL